MRILWLSHLVPYPPKAGVLIRSHGLLRALARQFQIDLLAFNQPALMRGCFQGVEQGLRESRAALGSFLRIIGIEDIPAERAPLLKYGVALASLLSSVPYSIRWLASRRYAEAVAAALADNHYDLIHVDTEALAPYVPAGVRCPVALDHHNVESHMMLRRAEKERNPLKAAYFRLEAAKLLKFEARQFRRFSTHVVCSPEDAQRLLAIDPGLQVYTAPNGVDFPSSYPRRSPPPAGSPPRLLFVGGLTWYPNRDAIIHLLEDIWPVLQARIPGISVDIVGKSPSSRIRALAARSTGVRLHGFVDRIEPFYESATAYVCPIRDGGGTKLKVIDAMAMGVPIIGHPLACEGLGMSAGEHVLYAVTAEDYVAAVTRMAADPASAGRISMAAFDLGRRRFDAGSVGTGLAGHYAQVIGQHAGNRGAA